MDTELFELCRKVYDLLEWQIDDATWVVGDENGDLFILTKEVEEQGHYDYYAPLYTSDYLLERLPFPSQLDRDSFAWIGKWEQGAGSAPKRQVWERSNTPLKALLKLTLALHEAGELQEKR